DRKRTAGHIDDLDRGRPLGDFQRLNRRQVRAGPGDHADGADDQPQAEHKTPIDRAADERALGPRFARLARAFFSGRGFAATAWAVIRVNAQFGTAVEHWLPARARLSPSRHHATRLYSPAATAPAPKRHAKGRDLRGR